MSNYKRNMNIGLAGEYIVASIMSLKGWDASLTLKNYPCADIFGYNPKLDKHIRIQVKTTVGQSSYMTGLLLSSKANEDDVRPMIKGPYVFVYYNAEEAEKGTFSMPRFFILSKENMIKVVIKENNNFFNKPREGKVKDVQPLAIKVKSLEEFEDLWYNLWVE